MYHCIYLLEVKNWFIIGIPTAQHKIIQNDGLSLQWFSCGTRSPTDECSRHIFEKTNAWNCTEEDGNSLPPSWWRDLWLESSGLKQCRDSVIHKTKSYKIWFSKGTSLELSELLVVLPARHCSSPCKSNWTWPHVKHVRQRYVWNLQAGNHGSGVWREMSYLKVIACTSRILLSRTTITLVEATALSALCTVECQKWYVTASLRDYYEEHWGALGAQLIPLPAIPDIKYIVPECPINASRHPM